MKLEVAKGLRGTLNAVAVVMLVSTGLWTGQALANTGDGPRYITPWGMAGCGLWSQVFKGRDRTTQMAITIMRQLPYVGSIDSQTSGISSGTSGCVEKKPQWSQKEQQVFIEVNLASLRKQAARGEGQTLLALSEVFGCPDSGKFAAFSRAHYQSLYGDDSAALVHTSYLEHMKDHSIALGQCVRT